QQHAGQFFPQTHALRGLPMGCRADDFPPVEAADHRVEKKISLHEPAVCTYRDLTAPFKEPEEGALPDCLHQLSITVEPSHQSQNFFVVLPALDAERPLNDRRKDTIEGNSLGNAL